MPIAPAKHPKTARGRRVQRPLTTAKAVNRIQLSRVPNRGWSEATYRTSNGKNLLRDLVLAQRVSVGNGIKKLAPKLLKWHYDFADGVIAEFSERAERVAGVSGARSSTVASDDVHDFEMVLHAVMRGRPMTPLIVDRGDGVFLRTHTKRLSTITLKPEQHEALWTAAIETVMRERELEFVSINTNAIQSTVDSSHSATVNLIGGEDDRGARARLQTRVRNLASRVTRISESTRDRMRAILGRAIYDQDLTVAETASNLRDKFREVGRYRSSLIARTEMGQAADEGRRLALKDSKTVLEVSVIGCEAREPHSPQYRGESTCNIANVPVADIDQLVFHPNHTGTIVPSRFVGDPERVEPEVVRVGAVTGGPDSGVSADVAAMPRSVDPAASLGGTFDPDADPQTQLSLDDAHQAAAEASELSAIRARLADLQGTTDDLSEAEKLALVARRTEIYAAREARIVLATETAIAQSAATGAVIATDTPIRDEQRERDIALRVTASEDAELVVLIARDRELRMAMASNIPEVVEAARLELEQISFRRLSIQLMQDTRQGRISESRLVQLEDAEVASMNDRISGLHDLVESGDSTASEQATVELSRINARMREIREMRGNRLTMSRQRTDATLRSHEDAWTPQSRFNLLIAQNNEAEMLRARLDSEYWGDEGDAMHSRLDAIYLNMRSQGPESRAALVAAENAEIASIRIRLQSLDMSEEGDSFLGIPNATEKARALRARAQLIKASQRARGDSTEALQQRILQLDDDTPPAAPIRTPAADQVGNSAELAMARGSLEYQRQQIREGNVVGSGEEAADRIARLEARVAELEAATGSIVAEEAIGPPPEAQPPSEEAPIVFRVAQRLPNGDVVSQRLVSHSVVRGETPEGAISESGVESGFMDQFGVFYSMEEAAVVVARADLAAASAEHAAIMQRVRSGSGDAMEVSEDELSNVSQRIQELEELIAAAPDGTAPPAEDTLAADSARLVQINDRMNAIHGDPDALQEFEGLQVSRTELVDRIAASTTPEDRDERLVEVEAAIASQRANGVEDDHPAIVSLMAQREAIISVRARRRVHRQSQEGASAVGAALMQEENEEIARHRLRLREIHAGDSTPETSEEISRLSSRLQEIVTAQSDRGVAEEATQARMQSTRERVESDTTELEDVTSRLDAMGPSQTLSDSQLEERERLRLRRQELRLATGWGVSELPEEERVRVTQLEDIASRLEVLHEMRVVDMNESEIEEARQLRARRDEIESPGERAQRMRALTGSEVQREISSRINTGSDPSDNPQIALIAQLEDNLMGSHADRARGRLDDIREEMLRRGDLRVLMESENRELALVDRRIVELQQPHDGPETELERRNRVDRNEWELRFLTDRSERLRRAASERDTTPDEERLPRLEADLAAAQAEREALMQRVRSGEVAVGDDRVARIEARIDELSALAGSADSITDTPLGADAIMEQMNTANSRIEAIAEELITGNRTGVYLGRQHDELIEERIDLIDTVNNLQAELEATMAPEAEADIGAVRPAIGTAPPTREDQQQIELATLDRRIRHMLSREVVSVAQVETLRRQRDELNQDIIDAASLAADVPVPATTEELQAGALRLDTLHEQTALDPSGTADNARRIEIQRLEARDSQLRVELEIPLEEAVGDTIAALDGAEQRVAELEENIDSETADEAIERRALYARIRSLRHQLATETQMLADNPTDEFLQVMMGYEDQEAIHRMQSERWRVDRRLRKLNDNIINETPEDRDERQALYARSLEVSSSLRRRQAFSRGDPLVQIDLPLETAVREEAELVTLTMESQASELESISDRLDDLDTQAPTPANQHIRSELVHRRETLRQRIASAERRGRGVPEAGALEANIEEEYTRLKERQTELVRIAAAAEQGRVSGREGGFIADPEVVAAISSEQRLVRQRIMRLNGIDRSDLDSSSPEEIAQYRQSELDSIDEQLGQVLVITGSEDLVTFGRADASMRQHRLNERREVLLEDIANASHPVSTPHPSDPRFPSSASLAFVPPPSDLFTPSVDELTSQYTAEHSRLITRRDELASRGDNEEEAVREAMDEEFQVVIRRIDQINEQAQAGRGRDDISPDEMVTLREAELESIDNQVRQLAVTRYGSVSLDVRESAGVEQIRLNERREVLRADMANASLSAQLRRADPSPTEVAEGGMAAAVTSMEEVEIGRITRREAHLRELRDSTTFDVNRGLAEAELSTLAERRQEITNGRLERGDNLSNEGLLQVEAREMASLRRRIRAAERMRDVELGDAWAAASSHMQDMENRVDEILEARRSRGFTTAEAADSARAAEDTEISSIHDRIAEVGVGSESNALRTRLTRIFADRERRGELREGQYADLEGAELRAVQNRHEFLIDNLNRTDAETQEMRSLRTRMEHLLNTRREREAVQASAALATATQDTGTESRADTVRRGAIAEHTQLTNRLNVLMESNMSGNASEVDNALISETAEVRSRIQVLERMNASMAEGDTFTLNQLAVYENSQVSSIDARLRHLQVIERGGQVEARVQAEDERRNLQSRRYIITAAQRAREEMATEQAAGQAPSPDEQAVNSLNDIVRQNEQMRRNQVRMDEIESMQQASEDGRGDFSDNTLAQATSEHDALTADNARLRAEQRSLSSDVEGNRAAQEIEDRNALRRAEARLANVSSRLQQAEATRAEGRAAFAEIEESDITPAAQAGLAEIEANVIRQRQHLEDAQERVTRVQEEGAAGLISPEGRETAQRNLLEAEANVESLRRAANENSQEIIAVHERRMETEAESGEIDQDALQQETELREESYRLNRVLADARREQLRIENLEIMPEEQANALANAAAGRDQVTEGETVGIEEEIALEEEQARERSTEGATVLENRIRAIREEQAAAHVDRMERTADRLEYEEAQEELAGDAIFNRQQHQEAIDSYERRLEEEEGVVEDFATREDAYDRGQQELATAEASIAELRSNEEAERATDTEETEARIARMRERVAERERNRNISVDIHGRVDNLDIPNEEGDLFTFSGIAYPDDPRIPNEDQDLPFDPPLPEIKDRDPLALDLGQWRRISEVEESVSNETLVEHYGSENATSNVRLRTQGDSYRSVSEEATLKEELKRFDEDFEGMPDDVVGSLMAGLPEGSSGKHTIRRRGDKWGFESEVEMPDPKDPSDTLTMRVEMTFNPADGELYHDLMKVNGSADQAQGFGKKFILGQYGTLRKLGINKVNFSANLDVGGYAWVRYGAAMKRPNSAKVDMKHRIEAAIQFLGPDAPEIGLLKELVDPAKDWGPFELRKIAALKRVVEQGGKTEKIGKHILLGSQWKGLFDFNDEKSTKALEAYLEQGRRKKDDAVQPKLELR